MRAKTTCQRGKRQGLCPPPCNCPHKNASCNRECCFPMRKGVNKNATSTAARGLRESMSVRQSHTTKDPGTLTRKLPLFSLLCHHSHLFLHLLRLHHTWICPFSPSAHPYTHHPVTPLPAHHTPTHLISIAITDAPPAAQTPVTCSSHLLLPRPYLHTRKR